MTVLDGWSPERRAFVAQAARYGVTGLIVTAISISAYLAALYLGGLAPQIANLVSYCVGVTLGYIAHSRYSFRGHGRRDNPLATTSRFVGVSLVSLGLNGLWVWLLTERLGLPGWTPTPLMLTATPAVVFMLNRLWVFR